MALKRHRLAQQRESRGFTQEALAELMQVDRSTVARWESGKADPRPWMRPRLARALGVTADGLQELLATTATDADPQADRRQYAARHPERSDLETCAVLRADFQDLAGRYDQEPSAGLLAEAGRQLGNVTFLAGEARRGRVQRELRVLQSDTATFMGQLVWDASQRRDHDTAKSFYSQGVSVARHLRDHTLEGHALLRTAYVALYGDRDAATGLSLCLRAAATAADSSQALTGLAMLHAAEAHAMLGEATDCERALANAEEHLGDTEPTDAAAELISPSQFGRLTGACYLSLGQLQRAEQVLAATAASLPDRPKSRAIVLGNLTLAHIRQGEVDTAVLTLGQAITDLEETRGGGGMNIVFGAARELRPWRRQPRVQDVHDRLLALMATT
ncbi:helix-turn-helix domain-containing protein [Streptomyces sp. UNOC14_S4]|uniref:helix-turn-helix domain-containing protein n=1 Tax=Streptomyces sp. UNOC14_S4 TaxID=2872340 RepID=UPI001E4324EF|nr:helix-turn-helix transcriptional regulator [Streptomyces sp. UNOC14_S4]MCC3767996.1 helix-turn-helix transcriptional regulator [Streptomyces sp. UNOC14_S4]